MLVNDGHENRKGMRSLLLDEDLVLLALRSRQMALLLPSAF